MKSDHRGARGARKGENAEKGPKFQKRSFFGISQKFSKHVFCTNIQYPNTKFGGPGVKNGHFTAKNVFFRFFENINLLKTRKLKKLRHAKSISSYNSQYFSTGPSFLESGSNCAHNLFVRFWNFAPRTWVFPANLKKRPWGKDVDATPHHTPQIKK